MNIFKSVIIFLALTGAVQAAETPITRLADDAIEYDSMEQAAIAGALAAAALSDSVEYGGVIVFCSDTQKFLFTAPVTTHQERRVAFLTKLPKVCDVVGLYHSHPLNDGKAHQFSDTDMQTSRKFDVPMFIGVRVQEAVRQFMPRKLSRTETERVVYSKAGRRDAA